MLLIKWYNFNKCNVFKTFKFKFTAKLFLFPWSFLPHVNMPSNLWYVLYTRRARLSTWVPYSYGYCHRFLYVYLGIRYAEAPVGDLRFSKPVSAAGWTGVREATEVGQSCPQINYLNPTGAVNSISIDYSSTLVRNRKWQQCCSVTCYLVVMACVLLQAIPSDESKIMLSSHMWFLLWSGTWNLFDPQ